MMDWNGTHEVTGWMWLWMGIWSLLVIAGIVALVVLAVRAVQPHRGGTRESALDVLKRRYAAGEINDEQYEQQRRKLEG